MMCLTAALVAEHSRSRNAQLAAAQVPELRDRLYHSVTLHPDVVRDLVTPRRGRPVAAGLLTTLVANRMDPVAAATVAATDTRPRVLTTLLRNNPPTEQLLDRLVDSPELAAKVADKVATHWWGRLPVAFTDAVFAAASGRLPLLAPLRPGSTLAPDVVAAKLERFPEWGSKFHAADAARLLAHRPDLLGVYLGQPALHTAAAGSLVLAGNPAAVATLADLPGLTANHGDEGWLEQRMYTYLALFANPVVDVAVVADLAPLWARAAVPFDMSFAARNRMHMRPWTVTDPAGETDPVRVNHLAVRATPGAAKPAGRVWDLPAVAANPVLFPARAVEIATALLDRQLAQSRDNVAGDVTTTLGVLADRFPEVSHLLAAHPGWDSPADDPVVVVPDDEPVLGPDRAWRLLTQVQAGGPDRGWFNEQGTMALDEVVPDDPAVWATVLSLLDSFPGTVAELVTVATDLHQAPPRLGAVR